MVRVMYGMKCITNYTDELVEMMPQENNWKIEKNMFYFRGIMIAILCRKSDKYQE